MKYSRIRSKAQIKRLLKRFKSYNQELDLIFFTGTKTGRSTRPVSGQELSQHNITTKGWRE